MWGEVFGNASAGSIDFQMPPEDTTPPLWDGLAQHEFFDEPYVGVTYVNISTQFTFLLTFNEAVVPNGTAKPRNPRNFDGIKGGRKHVSDTVSTEKVFVART